MNGVLCPSGNRPGPLLVDLSKRRRQPELMDSPELDPAHHAQALRALARINALSLAAGRLWAILRRRSSGSDGPIRVLDVACGGGDVAMAIQA